MFFVIAKEGTIEICAETEVQPAMTELTPPDDFRPEEMDRWLIKDGQFVRNEDYVEPPKPVTTEERIAALEAQLAAYEAAYAEGVNEA